MDDLLDLLESNEKPFQETQVERPQYQNQNRQFNSGPKKVSLWDKQDFTPAKVDPGTFKTHSKLFTIKAHSTTGTIPASITERFIEISKVLATKSFGYRYGGRSDDTLQSDIIKTEGLKTEIYLPWKKFNVDVKTDHISPTEKAYSIALNSHKVFYKLPPAVRAVISNDVHLLLGEDCNTPLDFLLVYSECGSEALSKQVDYKKLGPIVFLLKVAGDANIPVFNFKNEDAVKRLVDFIKSHHS